MSLEEFSHAARKSESVTAPNFAYDLQKLSQEDVETAPVFDQLEKLLENRDFQLGTGQDVMRIFNDNSLLCRSENFSNVIQLFTEHTPIAITNVDDHANMCTMMSGEGFRTAMSEGFSGKDVGNHVKTVITFTDGHVHDRHKIPATDELWRTKPSTAEVSLAGKGSVYFDDIKMVSFRFPIHFFPERLLTEEEKDHMEEGGIHFIVRHYILKKENTVH